MRIGHTGSFVLAGDDDRRLLRNDKIAAYDIQAFLFSLSIIFWTYERAPVFCILISIINAMREPPTVLTRNGITYVKRAASLPIKSVATG